MAILACPRLVTKVRELDARSHSVPYQSGQSPVSCLRNVAECQ